MLLIVTAIFPPEPVVSANLSFDIASQLAKAYRVQVTSPKPTRPYGLKYKKRDIVISEFEHSILKTYTCPKSNFAGRILESYSLGVATRKFILKNKKSIGIIYANTWPVFAQFYLVKTAKKLNIPVILHVQDIYPESILDKLPFFIGKIISRIILRIDRFVLQNSTKVIAISPQMKDYLTKSRCLDSSSVVIVRNWQNDERFMLQKENQYSRHDNVFTFMYLGSISPSAGVEHLIESFASAKLENVRLIVAGEGSDKEKCISLAKRYPDSGIEFWEAPLDKVPDIQSKANVMLLPLRKGIGKTASPSKLTAYMFSKKPIIACVDDDSDTADIVSESGCGWILPPEDKASLSLLMKTIVALPDDILKEKGENAFKYAVANLSRKNNLQKIVDIINETTKHAIPESQ